MKKLLIILYLLLSQSVWATTTPDSKQIDVLKQKLQTCYNQFNNPKHQACLQTLTNCLQDDEHITQAHTCFIDVAEELTSLYLPDYTTIKQDLTDGYNHFNRYVKAPLQQVVVENNAEKPNTPQDMFLATKVMYNEVKNMLHILPVIHKMKQYPDLFKETGFVNPLFNMTLYPTDLKELSMHISPTQIRLTDNQTAYVHECQLVQNNLMSLLYRCTSEYRTESDNTVAETHRAESFHRYAFLASRNDSTPLNRVDIMHVKWGNDVLSIPLVVYLDNLLITQ